MILRALYDLAVAEGLVPDIDLEGKPITWLIQLGEDGTFLGFSDTRTTPPAEGQRKPKPVAKTYFVPREPERTSGDRAFLLFDKAEYVLGIDPVGSRPAEKLAARSGLFRQRVQDCLATTGDPAVAAVMHFLQEVKAGQGPTLPEDCASNDLFAFVYAPDVDRLVTVRPAVLDYWRTLRREEISASQPARCLVTGKIDIPAAKHGQLKGVPGGSTSGVALVSFNARAFESYGWKGNDNAAVSQDAVVLYATALQRLLSSSFADPNHPGRTLPRRNLRINETVICYWTESSLESDGSEDSDFADLFPSLLEPDPEIVGGLYRSIWTGRAPDLEDPSRFYALVLSGAQGRAVIRDWFESSVGAVAKNLAAHFGDLRIERITPPPRKGGHPPQFALSRLLQALSPPGREGVPGPLVAQFIESVLKGSLYPVSFLQKAVQRARAEISNDDWTDLDRMDSRAALIKAVLNRRRRFQLSNIQEVKPAMDPNNTSPGYLLGRLMAVLERLQKLAQGDLNANVIDRFFSSASASPAAVFPRLLKGARHHSHKLKEDDKGGLSHWLNKQIDELLAPFEIEKGGFPAFLPLEQQGLFVLGYHQQRHWLSQSKQQRQEAEAAASGE